MQKIRNSTIAAKKSVDRARMSVDKFGSRMLNAQSGIASFAGILGGAAVLGTVNNFETSMNKLGAVSLATDDIMSQFRETAKRLGATTQFSASQAAEGMIFLKMAGLDANKVMEAIPGTLQLAAAGGLDLGTAADIATNVLAQMRLEIKDLTRVNDVLAVVQSNANTNILQAAEAMKNVGATAAPLGVSLEQTTALLGVMADAGLKGGEAGTLLRNAMLKLVRPSAKAQKTLRRLGIDMRKFVTPEGKIKNFSVLIEQLGKRGATTAQLFNIFEERGARAILTLVGRGKPAIDKLETALSKAGGSAQKMAEIQMKGLPGVIKLMASAWEAVQIALFESGLADLLIAIFKRIANIFSVLTKTNPLLLKVVGIAGLVMLALGPLLMMIGFIAMGVSGLMTAWSFLTGTLLAIIGPITAIVIAVGLLVGGIARAVQKNQKLRDSFSRLLKVIGVILSPLKKVWDMLGGIEGTTNALVFIFESFADLIGNILTVSINALAIALENLVKASAFVQKGFNFLFGGEGVAAQGAAATQGSINGRIEVAGVDGATVKSATMDTDVGDLGFNMGGQ
jgi:TP901 family phage tail tape measure protein